MTTKISVIIPVYKVEKYLKHCIDSVLKQTYPNLEIILIDDGSPDNSPQICDEYAKKIENIKVIHKENGGLSTARNAGIRVATGKYIMFLDSDDWWNEDVQLEKMIREFEEHPDAQMACFNSLEYIRQEGIIKRYDDVFYENEHGVLDKLEYYKKVVRIGNLQESACTKIFNREFLITNNLFFQDEILGEDTEWMFRVLRKINKVVVLSTPLFIYRYAREGSITNSISSKNVTDLVKIISQSVEYYEKHPNHELKEYELGHCSYLWFIAISMFSKLPTKEQKNVRCLIKKYSYLTMYAMSSKVKLSKLVFKTLGIKGTAIVLNTYVELSRKNILKRGRRITNAR